MQDGRQQDDPVLEVPASHLYPGLTIALQMAALQSSSEQPACLVVFNDGSMAAGKLAWQEGAAWRLDVAAYMTTKRTRVVARSWLLTQTAVTVAKTVFRVAAKLG